MTADIIDGKTIAQNIRTDVKQAVTDRISKGFRLPGLATVLVGEDPASQVYVRNKQKACKEVGIISFGHTLAGTVGQTEVEQLINQLNEDPNVDGILVQLPLPKHLDEERILSLIDLNKDVDGFNPINIGRLAKKGREPLFVPCTPAGIIYLLNMTVKTISGSRAVVLGRSNIVGMPVALLLVKANATVTICHSHTRDLKDVVREADILVAAIGQPEMVKQDWVKPGAVVVDVGINRVQDSSQPKGSRLVGDVAYDEVANVASAITPVPGGVGPMTIAMLLKNTLHAAEISDQAN